MGSVPIITDIYLVRTGKSKHALHVAIGIVPACVYLGDTARKTISLSSNAFLYAMQKSCVVIDSRK